MSLDGRTVYGFTGHRSVENYRHMFSAAKSIAKEACDNNAIISLGGADGSDLEIMRHCITQQVQYGLRLAFKSRLIKLKEIFTNKRTCLFITWEADEWRNKSDNRFYFIRNAKIVEDARNSDGFYKKMNAYWDHRRAGGTFKCIEKALTRGVIVVNWYDMSTLRVLRDLKGVR